MLIESFTRAKGGTAERTVRIEDVRVPDIRTCMLFLRDKRWLVPVSRYHDDLVALLDVIRNDLALPNEFFVPGLWATSKEVADSDSKDVIDLWTLGRDLADALGYKLAASTISRNGVGGTLYMLPRGAKTE